VQDTVLTRCLAVGIAGRSRLLQDRVLICRLVVGGGSVPRALGCGDAVLGTAKDYIEQFFFLRGTAALGRHKPGQPRAAVPHSRYCIH